MALAIVGIVTVGLLALWVVSWAVSPRCPRCGSKWTECRGEWDGVSFHACRACRCNFDRDYRST